MSAAAANKSLARRIGRPLLAAAVLAAGPCFAQDSDSALSGRVSLGVRGVDVDGASSKFKEDVNLDDGVRLFDAALSYAPEPDANAAVDRIDLDVGALGGDPFERIGLHVRKHGAYKLELNRRRSEYFYEDVILPRRFASIEGSTGGDFHEFDFERVHDEAALDITLSPATELNFDLERYTRRGDSTTTLGIQRDEFELARPIDESLEAFGTGIQHAWSNVTVIYELESRDFDNASELFLPGASAGANPDDAAELRLFSFDQSYDYQSLAHLVRVVAQPTARLDVQAAWRFEDLDLDMAGGEHAEGIGFNGEPFSTDTEGTASIGRDIELGEVGFGYGVNERLRVTGNVRHLTLEQRGALLFGGDAGSGLWDVETTGAEAGVELVASSSIVVSVGLSSESRDVARASSLASTELDAGQRTQRDGFFTRLTYNGGGGLEIVASIEDDDIDDPYTLASPDASRRYRIRGRHRWDNGLSLSASLRRDDVENAASGWDADTTQANVRLAYGTDALDLSLGLTRIDLGRRIDQLVTGGFRQDLFEIDYDADARFVDGHARWQLNDKLALGGSFRLYENEGSFPLERDDLRGFVELELTEEYLLQVRYRDIEYDEDRFDDYDARLLELALGMRW